MAVKEKVKNPVIRNNIMTIPGYSPYCGDMFCPTNPRSFFNGEQFECSVCGWVSQFEEEFIEKYKEKWSKK